MKKRVFSTNFAKLVEKPRAPQSMAHKVVRTDFEPYAKHWVQRLRVREESEMIFD